MIDRIFDYIFNDIDISSNDLLDVIFNEYITHVDFSSDELFTLYPKIQLTNDDKCYVYKNKYVTKHNAHKKLHNLITTIDIDHIYASPIGKFMWSNVVFVGGKYYMSSGIYSENDNEVLYGNGCEFYEVTPTQKTFTVYEGVAETTDNF